MLTVFRQNNVCGEGGLFQEGSEGVQNDRCLVWVVGFLRLGLYAGEGRSSKADAALRLVRSGLGM
jgi:hypothetical protein